MSQIIIDIGDAPDDGLGTPLRQAFSDINTMFTAVYGAGPVDSNIAIANNTITTSKLNGNIILAPSGIGVTQFNSSALPRINDVYDLGSPTLRWNTLYLGTGGFESVGNITGNYFIGNGSLLTGVIAEPGPILANGTSNISIPTAGGPILFAIDNNANVFVVSNSNATFARPIVGTSANLSGNLISGNLNTTNLTTTGNAVIGGNLTVTGNTTFINVQNLNVEDPIIGLGRGANNAPLTSNDGKDRGEQLWYYSGSEKSAFIGYDNSAGNLILATNVTIASEIVSVNDYGNITIGNLQGQYLVATANVTGGNFITAGLITATGNISTSANINASHIQGNISGTSLSMSGNIYGNNLFANTNITAFGNVTAQKFIGNLDAAGNITEVQYFGLDDVISANDQFRYDYNSYILYVGNGNNGNVVSDNFYSTSKIETAGYVTATGNITGGSFITGGFITASGNINSSSNIQGANLVTPGLVTATGNIIGGNISTAGNISGGNLIALANISAAANVTGTYFIGNGALLSGIDTTLISNGTSNVKIVSANGNATININGTSNVAVFASTGEYVTGEISASGNVTGANLVTAGLISSTGNVIGGNLVTAGAVTSTGNIVSSANISGNFVSPGANREMLFNDNGLINSNSGITFNKAGPTLTLTNAAGTVITGYLSSLGGTDLNLTPATNNLVIWGSANPRFSNTYTLGTSSFQWLNVWAGNANIGSLSVSGNSTLVGNVSLTANLSAGNISTSGVVTATGNIVSAANVTGGNITTAGLVTATGNIVSAANVTGGNITTAGLVTATGNVTGGNITTAGLVTATGNITSTANVTGGNLVTGGLVTATGNITSTANVTGGNLVTGGLVTATGNITGGNLVTTGVVSTNNVVGSLSNVTITAGSYVTTFDNTGAVTFPGNTSATGNVTGGNIITGGLVTATGNITSTANVTGGNLITGGRVVATGNITSSGNVTGANITTAGLMTATGNIVSAANVIGSNVVATQTVYGANIAATQFSYANNFIASANVLANNINSNNIISATGNIIGSANISGANLITTGLITASGNIRGNNFIAVNNVEVLGNKITTGTNTGLLFEPGNVSLISGNLIVDGGFIYSQNGDTAIALVNNGEIGSIGIYNNLQVGKDGQGNLDVAGYANVTGDTSIGGNTSVTGNVIGGNISTAGQITATANITGGNIITAGIITATGNINTSGNVNAANVVTANINAPSAGITITAAAGDYNIFLQPSGNGTVDIADHRITNVGTPQAPDDAATKQYVDDSVSAGIHIHEPVRLETGAALTATYANGGTAVTVDSISGNKTLTFTTSPALSVDDMIVFSNSFNGLTAGTAYFVYSTNGSNQVTLSTSFNGVELTGLTNGGPGLAQAALVNSGIGATLTNAGANIAFTADSTAANVADRILVYNQANAAWNGVYVVSNVGNASIRWVLTRASDADYYAPSNTSGASTGDYFYVTSGLTGAGESYVLTAPTGPIIFGTSNITYTQFSASQVYSGANGIAITGAVITANVDNDTTAISNGNIVVKAGANLTTPNIGAATGSSLTLTGNISANNIAATNYLSASIINATANITGGNLISNGAAVITGNASAGNLSITNFANISGNLHAFGNAHFGQDLSFNASYANMQYGGTANSYVQLVVQNKDNGSAASTDFVATADNGTDNDTYIDMGINSSGYNQPAFALQGVNDGYLYVAGNTTTGGGNLVLSTLENNDIIFSTGGANTGDEIGRFQHGNGFLVLGNIYGSNVSANYFIGDGSQLTNISVAAGTQIISGNSNVSIATPNGNVTVSVGGQSNIAVVSTAGLFLSGYLSATGNLTGNYVYANVVSATGNITGDYFQGNGYYLTGIITSVANINNGTSNIRIETSGGNILANVGGTANVWQLTPLGQYVAGDIEASANITANNFIGNANASSLTSGTVPSARLSGTYNINISGIAATSNTVTDAAQPNITSVGTLSSLSVSGNAAAGNISTAGLITVTGNVTGGNINTSGVLTAGGNVTGGNINTGGLVTATGNITSTANVTGGNLITTGLITATGNITTVGNVSGNYILGNGYYLTDVVINNGTSNLRIDTANGNILANVNGTANTLAVTQEGLILGNTTVANIQTLAAPLWITPATGQYVSLNSNNYSQLYWTSNIENLSPGGNDDYAWVYVHQDGVYIETNPQAGNQNQWTFRANGVIDTTYDLVSTGNAYVAWLESGSDVLANANISAVGNVSGNYFLGNGYYLTGVITSVANINNGSSNVRIDTSGGNILANVGGVANVFAITTAGANVAGNLDVTSNISASYYIGNGYYLTGIITSVANINNGTSNIRIDTSGGNAYANIGGTANVLTIAATGLYVSGVSSTSGNVTGGNIDTAGLITATGDITSTANVIGGNINTVGLVSASGNVIGGNITTVGSANVGSLTVAADALISGNLTVNGNTNYINVTNLNVQDPIIGIGRGANNAPLSSDDGKDRGEQLWYYSGSEKSAFIGYDNSAGNLIAATNVSISNEIVTVNDYGNFVVGTLSAQAVSSTTTVAATGNLSAGNITSNGIITSTGNITSSGNISGSYFIGNGSALTGIASFDTVYWQLSVQGNVTGDSAGNSVLTASNSLGVLLPRAGNGIALVGNATTNVLTVEILGSTNDGTLWGAGGDCGLVTQAVSYYYDNGTVTDLTLTASYDLGELPGVVEFNTESIVGNLIPQTTNLYTIGNTAKQWQDLYINGTSYLSVVSATGNILASSNVVLSNGYITASGNITTSANVSADYVLGNGYFLSGIITSVSNINLGTSNIRVTTSGGNIAANVGATSNVWVLSTTGEYVTGVVSATGNITGGNIDTAGLVTATGNITSTANVTGGNLITAGIVSATGNVTGNYFLGNGACLTGVITSVANINNGTSNVRIDSSGGNVLANVGGTANVFTITTNGITTINNLVINSSVGAAEGAQMVLAYKGITGLTGQGNATWNIDVNSSNVFRIFYQDASSNTGVPISVDTTGLTVSNVSITGNITGAGMLNPFLLAGM